VLADAASFSEHTTLASLSADTLRDISCRHGVDFATALLYDRVRRSSQHATFIAQIAEQTELSRANSGGGIPRSRSAGTPDATIAVIPAAFYKEKPHSGADGRVVREAAAQLGLGCELIPLQSTGTLAENAAILLDWLAAHHDKSVILVSLCKGGADVKFALNSPDAGARFANVAAWVNICGTLNGSPVARWLLATRPRFFAAWLFCKCKRLNFDFLRELVPSPRNSPSPGLRPPSPPLAAGEREGRGGASRFSGSKSEPWLGESSPPSPLSVPLRLPPGLRLVSIVGFPLRRHLTNAFMRRCHQIISPLGPNDGGLLLADACHLPGVVYPVWGADHYLRPQNRGRQIIAAVLLHLLEARSPSGPLPADGIPASDQTARTPLA